MKMDLGRKIEAPEPAEVDESANEPDMSYPHLYIEGGDELKDLPDSGELTVKYVKTSHSQSVDKGEDPRHSICLEIKSIEDVESDEDETKEDEDSAASETLDKYAKEESEKD